MDLNQITLNVTNFGAALSFYHRLGLSLIVLSEDRYARFELPTGGATLSLHAAEVPTLNGPVTYFECENVDATYERLRAIGIAFDTDPRDEPWLWREVRLRDPSGNKLCLYHAGGNRRFPPWRLDVVEPLPVRKTPRVTSSQAMILAYP